MSGISKKRSKIKLRVKDKQQKDVFLDVSPQDTFETLQLRAEKEIGLALDLRQFSYCGQRIDTKGNVIEYFRNICKGGAKEGVTSDKVVENVEPQPTSGVSPAQMSFAQSGSGSIVPESSGNQVDRLDYSNVKLKGIPAVTVKKKSEGRSKNHLGKLPCTEIPHKEVAEDFNYISDDMMMQVVEDEVEIQEEGSFPMQEVKSETVNSCDNEVIEECEAEVPVTIGAEDSITVQGSSCNGFQVVEGRVQDALGSSAVLCRNPSQVSIAGEEDAVERMEVVPFGETVVVKDEIEVVESCCEVQASADVDCHHEEWYNSDLESLDSVSSDIESFADFDDDVDFGQLCRLCGKEKRNMVFIFSKEGMDMCLKEKINSWLPMTVSKTDQFPKQVCEKCIVKVSVCQDFGTQCLRAQKFLQWLVSENKFRCTYSSDAAAVTSANKRHGDGVMNSALKYVSPFDQDVEMEACESSSPPFCCPLCITGVMKAKRIEELDEESESLNSEHEMESNETELHKVQDDAVVINEADIKKEDPDLPLESLPLESNPATNVTAACDESAFFVETIMGGEESLNSMKEEQINEVGLNFITLPQKRGGQRGRGRGRGSRGRRGVQKERGEQGVVKSRGRGRGRGRGRANLIQQMFGAADDVPVSCCVCRTDMEGVSNAFLHTLLSHCTEPNSYLCSLCGESSENRNSIINHFSEVHACMVTAYERFGNKITLLYECRECSTIFRSEKTLFAHNCAQKFESKSLKCSVCGKTFVTKARLYFHQQFHSKVDRPMYCETCNIEFADEDTMYDHFKFSHRGEKYVCSICGTRFNSKTGCDTHEQMHTNKRINKRTFTCDVCSKSFFDKQTLKEHVISHMDSKPYQCHICGRDLSRPSRLKRHLKAHASYNAPPQDIYRCMTCDEVFCNQEQAYEHTQADQLECKIEDGAEHEFAKESIDKVYRCEFCEKCYLAPGVLNYHRDGHQSDPTPYRCHICGTGHVSFARCATHKVTHGLFIETDLGDFTVPKYYLCEFCGRYFLHWTYLSVHRRRQHSSIKYMVKGKNVFKPEVPSQNKPFRCEKCGRRYLLDWALEKHMKRHHSGDESSSYQCDNCGKIFSCKKFLLKHMAIHGERQFACEICDSSFVRASSLSIHMGRVHTVNKQHCCEHCGLEFVRKGDLIEHIRTHTGDRPYECEYCKKTFRTRGIWLQHTMIHRDERPYPCDVCGAAFRRSFALKNHMTIHTGVRAFVCEVCGKDFRMHQELTKHLRTCRSETDEETMKDDASEEKAPDKV